ncbi:MAG TPA: glutamate--tRNA ligase [Candidatus Binataceae bacterium]|nr:glutamate--tRNA ligase [Candidatus Binataceae bacterium]
MTVRTRYAPSPTGALHIGNVRSGLFAYLFARHNHGAFILRIDDTDEARSTTESLEEILESLGWLGVEWDEGPPDRKYFQSSRFQRYRESALMLLRENKAYPCYCTAEELDAMRKAAEREHRKPGYNGRCRDRTAPADLVNVELPDKAAGRNYTIRFRSPREGATVVDDLIKGRTVFENTELDDLIIFRSDGVPTYNFATVLDDFDFGITHVVRGDDHLPNTPRQMQIFYALGLTPPAYAHLPMVMGADGQKLSKRHGATSVFAYRDLGYFPEALLNYLVRLGWSHGDQEIFSLQEMFEYFDFASCGKSAGIFNAEKLLWINFHYMKELPLARIARDAKPFIAKKGWSIPGDEAWLEKMVATLRERAKTLVELVEFASFYLNDEITLDPKAVAKFLKPEIAEPLSALANEIDALTGVFSEAAIQAAFERVLARFDLKLGQLAQPVRVALTGGTVSPGIYEVIAVLGRDRTVARLRLAIARAAASI